MSKESMKLALEAVYETIIQWDEGGGKRSRRELARRIVALAEQPAQQVVDSDEKAGAYMEARLWEFIDMAAAWPKASPDPRTWDHVMVYAPKPAQQEQGDSICQEDDGCPTELAVLQRFWRGQFIPYEHYPTWCKPAPVPEAHEQEPVAWQVMVEDCAMKEFSTKDAADEWCVREKLSGSSYAYWIRPLYTSPPARKPLEGKHIRALWEQESKPERSTAHFFTAFARAIEAVHGIKGNT